MTTMAMATRANSDVLASYLEKFSQQAAIAAMRPMREAAFERFAALGFPHHKLEGWRHTNLAPVAERVFATQPVPADLEDRARSLNLPGVNWSAEAVRLVFVNGVFHRGLSSLPAINDFRVAPLSQKLQAGDVTVLATLESEADFEKDGLVALNTAFLSDGAWIEIGKNAQLEAPVSVLHLTTGATDKGGLSLPRTLVVANSGSKAAVIETFAGWDGEAYFTNAVTEIVVGENASLEYTQLGQQSRSAYHTGKLRSHQQRDSRFKAHAIALGGLLVRNNVHAILDGEGAECVLNGLFAVAGSQHVDNSTLLDHARPLCTSREYYKGVLDDRSEGVFNGRIIVRKDAQHTDAIQSNKNLLLSDSAATLSSQPQLEIYADDVRCTHGATVGQIDSQALFYLRSRGLGLEESRRLLIYAFAADVLGRIEAQDLRMALEKMLFARWTR